MCLGVVHCINIATSHPSIHLDLRIEKKEVNDKVVFYSFHLVPLVLVPDMNQTLKDPVFASRQATGHHAFRECSPYCCAQCSVVSIDGIQSCRSHMEIS